MIHALDGMLEEFDPSQHDAYCLRVESSRPLPERVITERGTRYVEEAAAIGFVLDWHRSFDHGYGYMWTFKRKPGTQEAR